MRIKHLRLALSSAALVGGSLILAISLSQSSQPAFSSSGSFDATQRRLYFDDILPDHVAYPVLMALDRVKLESASPIEEVHLQVEFGQRRLDYARALLEKGNQPLALATLTKSIKYLGLAGTSAIDQNMPASVRSFVSQAISFHLKEVAELQLQFSDSDRAVIDRLVEQVQAVQLHLSDPSLNSQLASPSGTPEVKNLSK